MAVITTKKRKRLKDKTFGLPEERKYPMHDKAHAANAKARAAQMVKKGKLTLAEKKKIKAAVRKPVLKRKSSSKRR
jgi:hypothetical protein